MKLSIIVPWRLYEGQRWRERVWAYLQPAWEELEAEIVFGVQDGGYQWCKGRAWDGGLRQSTGDLVCLMDGDCWVPDLMAAVELVRQGARWAQGQNMVHRFSQEVTEELLDGSLTLHQAMHLGDPFEEPARAASAGVGTILRREDAEAIPLDERFLGWGYEDNAWWDALSTLLGEPARLNSSICWHLWHPPQPDKDRRPHAKTPNWVLWRQYVRARGRPGRMQAVVDEALAQREARLALGGEPGT